MARTLSPYNVAALHDVFDRVVNIEASDLDGSGTVFSFIEPDKVAVTNAGRWIIAKVSTEELPGIAQRFRISAIPTLAVFKSGREIGRQAGAMLAPAIQQFVEQAISEAR